MTNRVVAALRSGKLSDIRAAIAADPKAAQHPGAIVAAAGSASMPTLKLLHRAGADLNAAWRNYRPLHALIQSEAHAAGHATPPPSERLKCLEWLLEHGADPELTGAWPSARAIIVAAFWGRPEYVDCLRRAGARVDGFVHAALGDAAAIEQALASHPSTAVDRDRGILTALHCAAGSRLPGVDTPAVARLLLDAGADPNSTARSWNHDVDAAYFACGSGRPELFEILLERGADATAALSHAVWGKHFELAGRALAHGAQPDRAAANGKPLLNDLIRWGQLPQTFWLLDRGASPDVRDGDGWTAAHQAASRGNRRLLEAVLAAGADLTLRDRAGCTPFDVARLHKRVELASILSGRTC